MGDRRAEETCLYVAIELAVKQRGWTKRFAKTLQAGLRNEFIKVDRNRPDFVMLCPSIKGEKNTLIGIEHFRVDLHVMKKANANQVASTAIVEQKELNKFYNEHRDKVLNSQQIPQETMTALAELLKRQIDAVQKATYGNFIASFEYGLKKHTPHIDAYWENLNSVKNSNDMALGFLIEIHADFDHLYMWHKGKIRKETGLQMPIFDDVVRLMEENIDAKKVSFVILYFTETFTPTKSKVVFVQTKKIRECLKRQNETIYKYCGDDFRLRPFELPYKESKLETNCITNPTGEKRLEISMARVETRVQHWEMHLFAAAHQAFCYEKENTPYVTTESVLLIIELLRGHILGWKSAQVPGAEWMKYPILKNYDRALFDRKYEEFKTRWHIDDGEDDG